MEEVSSCGKIPRSEARIEEKEFSLGRDEVDDVIRDVVDRGWVRKRSFLRRWV